MSFDEHRPPERALVDDCVHCGFCLPSCPTYALWGQEMDSPRDRVHLIAQALDGAPLAGAVEVGAERVALPRQSHQGAGAARAHGREFPGPTPALATRTAEHRPDHLGDHVARLAHDDRVPACRPGGLGGHRVTARTVVVKVGTSSITDELGAITVAAIALPMPKLTIVRFSAVADCMGWDLPVTSTPNRSANNSK